jgi:hypothetical protein
MQTCTPGLDCPIPLNDLCYLNPYAPGCALAIQSLPETFTSSSELNPQYLRDLSIYFNNGICIPQNFSPFLSIPLQPIHPGERIPENQIEHLRLLCAAGDSEACYSLALALSRICKEGNESACLEIAQLCNEKDDERLCDVELRRTCSRVEYQRLYNDYKLACDGFSRCDENDSCAMLIIKMVNRLECQDKRQAHARRCLGNAPDIGHQLQIDDANRHFEDCYSVYIRKRPPCLGRYLPERVQREIEDRY